MFQSPADFDVLGIGNAIVDIMARTEEDFLVRERLVQGLHAPDRRRPSRSALYALMGPAIEASGGSRRQYGGRRRLARRARRLHRQGRRRRASATSTATTCRRHGVHFDTPPLNGGAPTARSMILITPDGERTMNTYLGACQALAPPTISTSDGRRPPAITYLEGYLWDPPRGQGRFPQGRAGRPPRRPQGVADALRLLLRRPLSRRVPRAPPRRDGRCPASPTKSELRSLYETAISTRRSRAAPGRQAGGGHRRRRRLAGGDAGIVEAVPATRSRRSSIRPGPATSSPPASSSGSRAACRCATAAGSAISPPPR